jgi:cysteine dioxygenase
MGATVYSLPDVVERLERLDASQVTPERVTGLLGEGLIDEASLRRYLCFRDDKYARIGVHRSELFDVLVLCWRPGQLTPVHNHNGQMGWVRLLRGRIEETTWRLQGGGSTPDLTAVEIDDEGVGHGVELEPTGHSEVADPGTVVSVDRVRAIHRLGNPRRHAGDEPAVTLHVYSRPHDTCLTFDVEARTCKRQRMTLDQVGPAAG